MTAHKQRAKLDENLETCPICGSSDIPRIIFVKVSGYQGNLSYSNCQGCGQLFLNPRMSDEQTNRYYMGDYRNRLLGPTGVHVQDQTAQRLRASLQAQVMTIMNVVPFKVLDIGCGSGFLLWEWDKRGAVCTGVEPDVRCHDRLPANRYKVYADVSELPDHKFDLICMSHSLEHMNHPKEYLKNVLDKHAHKDTDLMIEVPNSECCTAAFRISHPMAFTRYTIEKLLTEVGYKVAHILYHGLSNTTTHRYLLVLAKREQGEIECQTRNL
jgi:2-polyprenyl-3-methyl-5-hydroxy-6-metoxy-1,4-benzoquinol methylase